MTTLLDTETLRGILQTHSPVHSDDDPFALYCAACEWDWPCERWNETFTPGLLGDLLAELDRGALSLEELWNELPRLFHIARDHPGELCENCEGIKDVDRDNARACDVWFGDALLPKEATR